MRLVNQSGEAYALIENQDFANTEARMAAYRKAGEQVLENCNTPIDLGAMKKLQYDQKSDRYISYFSWQDQQLILKTTNEVAQFLAEHTKDSGYWRGRMEEGTLVDVCLFQV